ncbi:hypothetical protein DFH09DRAFT_1090183 [Mycena vulgaris]|nr:hypothetical protein DFH09DRAFT_1090183 [Mycena vulgaris]
MERGGRTRREGERAGAGGRVQRRDKAVRRGGGEGKCRLQNGYIISLGAGSGGERRGAAGSGGERGTSALGEGIHCRHYKRLHGSQEPKKKPGRGAQERIDGGATRIDGGAARAGEGRPGPSVLEPGLIHHNASLTSGRGRESAEWEYSR